MVHLIIEKAKGVLPSWKKSPVKHEYWLTRFIFLRLLGIIYLFAFLILVHQAIPLIGQHGLLPAENYLHAISLQFETKTDAFVSLPTIFWLHLSDGWLLALAWLGVILS